jgi:DNA-binding transcriptional LysR family regulator
MVGRAVHLSAVKAFVAVATLGSTIEAAATLGFSQSAVSRQLADFERYVGTTLFARRQGGLRLNCAGTEVLPLAIEILRLAQTMPIAAAAQPQPRTRSHCQ